MTQFSSSPFPISAIASDSRTKERKKTHFTSTQAQTRQGVFFFPPFLFALSEKRRRRREGQIWEWGRVDDDLFLSNGEGEKGVGIKWWEGMKKDWAPFISFPFFP